MLDTLRSPRTIFFILGLAALGCGFYIEWINTHPVMATHSSLPLVYIPTGIVLLIGSQFVKGTRKACVSRSRRDRSDVRVMLDTLRSPRIIFFILGLSFLANGFYIEWINTHPIMATHSNLPLVSIPTGIVLLIGSKFVKGTRKTD